MPVDTRDKRASVLGVDSATPRMEQNPSGTIAQSGRQIAGHVYAGILAGSPVIITVSDLEVVHVLGTVVGLSGSAHLGGVGGFG
jgi:hypothetical protein